jgi:HlyD family secretion protein
MDTGELEAQERAAAAVVAQRNKDRDAAASEIDRSRSELDLAVTELKRGQALVAKDAISVQRVEQLTALQQTREAALAAAQSQMAAVEAQISSAKAEQERVQHMINDSTLTAPKVGRILYKLADIGETLPAGGQVASMLDLGQVYMTFFLPSTTAAKVEVRAPGRIVVDAAPDRPIPATVSFISPRAQFTPKQVETQTERERMMFRVKLRIPEPLVEQYMSKVKTGVTGVAYVKTDSNAEWPGWLQSDLTGSTTGSSEAK